MTKSNILEFYLQKTGAEDPRFCSMNTLEDAASECEWMTGMWLCEFLLTTD